MVFKENGWCELVIKIKFKITQLLVLYKKISTPSDSNIPPPDQYLNYFLGFLCCHLFLFLFLFFRYFLPPR